ncbi:hypothetical protein [Cryobacterium serini]|uniref:Uncharacterized protein n=1 Tax=Cryobacterium serini TaxID=1259201 RepID=A0A4R9BL97_9MICO|nr:hypothetical protein [Cryobacterium serini]TFD86775.1 hypothetical protein E3T51_10875 [Cryobacterium serini]
MRPGNDFFEIKHPVDELRLPPLERVQLSKRGRVARIRVGLVEQMLGRHRGEHLSQIEVGGDGRAVSVPKIWASGGSRVGFFFGLPDRVALRPKGITSRAILCRHQPVREQLARELPIRQPFQEAVNHALLWSIAALAHGLIVPNR